MPDTAAAIARVPAGTDLVEWYFEQGWTDGLPVVPPTAEKIAACIKALGGEPEFLECRVPPRYGGLTREILAVNMVTAGCKPDYAPVVRAALLVERHGVAAVGCYKKESFSKVADPALVADIAANSDIVLAAIGD